jgi:hypothetical protein
MHATTFAGIFARDVAALRREIEAYPDERQLWATPPGVVNSAGTLALHLIGNLRHFLGARLAGTGYVRHRDAEFARRDVDRRGILAEIALLESELVLLRELDDRRLGADFPEPISGMRIPTGEYLVHLVAHFAFHLGQLDYHRRVVTGSPAGVGAVRPAELPSAVPAEA